MKFLRFLLIFAVLFSFGKVFGLIYQDFCDENGKLIEMQPVPFFDDDDPFENAGWQYFGKAETTAKLMLKDAVKATYPYFCPPIFLSNKYRQCTGVCFTRWKNTPQY